MRYNTRLSSKRSLTERNGDYAQTMKVEAIQGRWWMIVEAIEQGREWCWMLVAVVVDQKVGDWQGMYLSFKFYEYNGC